MENIGPGKEIDKDITFYLRNNRLFFWLFGTGRFKLVRFAVIVFSWYVGAYFVCRSADILELKGDNNIGFLEDIISWASLLMDLLMVAALFYSFRKMNSLFQRLPKILGDPQSNNIDKQQIERIEKDIAWIRNFVSLRDRKSWRWYIGCLCMMTCLFYLLQIHFPIFAPNKERVYWASSPESSMTAYIYASVWTGFHFILVIGNVLWYVLSMGFTVFPMIYRYAKEQKLRVVPVTPDGKGGMSPVGEFSFSLTLVVSTGVIFCIAWLLSIGPERQLMIGFSLYMVLLVAVFFGPLLSVHNAMRDARERSLDWWSEFYLSEYYAFMTEKSVAEEGSDKISENTGEQIARLGNIDQLYRRVEAMPVWPFNFATLARFFTVIVTPLLIAAAKILPGILSGNG